MKQFFCNTQSGRVFFDIVHAQDVRTAFAQHRSESDRWRKAIAYPRRSNHLTEERFARNTDHDRAIMNPEAREVVRQSFEVLEYAPREPSRWEQPYQRFLTCLQ